ncbi:MAG: hypothetical protein ABIK28_17255, partial [Planctomycetota bacterium]
MISMSDVFHQVGCAYRVRIKVLLLFIGVQFVTMSTFFPVEAQDREHTNPNAQELSLEQVLYAFPIVEMTFSDGGLVYDQVAPNAAVFESETELVPLSLTMMVPNLDLTCNEKSAFVLGNIKYAVMSKEGKLLELVFKNSLP